MSIVISILKYRQHVYVQFQTFYLKFLSFHTPVYGKGQKAVILSGVQQSVIT
jgi:hypothetical protein